MVVMNDYEQWRTLPGIVLSAGPLPQLQQKGLGARGHSYHASIYMPVKSDWLVRVPRERTGALHNNALRSPASVQNAGPQKASMAELPNMNPRQHTGTL